MNIAYSCNDAYIEQTGVSMISVLENNKEEHDLTFYIISKDISENNICILKNIGNAYNREVIIIEFESICYDLNISNIGRHIETIYSKVFFGRIKGLSKIIYLDSDIIVNGSLRGLWDTDLSDCYMGVVQTRCTKTTRKALELDDSTPVFNDGMAIVNVDYCNENNLIDKIKNVIDKYNGNPPVLSEGALNIVCKGHVKFVDLKYNLMAGLLFLCRRDLNYMTEVLNQYDKEAIKNACDNPICIHYLSIIYNRPWFKQCTHPYKSYYYFYKSLSPWKETELRNKPTPLKDLIIKWGYTLLGVRGFELLRSYKHRL